MPDLMNLTREDPFRITPHERFFVALPAHAELRASLSRVLSEPGRIAMLTGEAGSGKTMIARRVLADAAEAGRATHSVVAAPGAALRQGIDEAALAPGTLLLVDEAHHLPPSEFAALAALAGGRNVGVLLAGQPTLVGRLADPDAASAQPLLVARESVAPLGTADIAAYVEGRLRSVGWDGALPFDAGALSRLAQRSRGLPRLVNTLAGNALVLAAIEGDAGIGRERIDEAADRLNLPAAEPEPAPATSTVADPAFPAQTPAAPQRTPVAEPLAVTAALAAGLRPEPTPPLRDEPRRLVWWIGAPAAAAVAAAAVLWLGRPNPPETVMPTIAEGNAAVAGPAPEDVPTVADIPVGTPDQAATTAPRTTLPTDTTVTAAVPELIPPRRPDLATSSLPAPTTYPALESRRDRIVPTPPEVILPLDTADAGAVSPLPALPDPPVAEEPAEPSVPVAQPQVPELETEAEGAAEIAAGPAIPMTAPPVVPLAEPPAENATPQIALAAPPPDEPAEAPVTEAQPPAEAMPRVADVAPPIETEIAVAPTTSEEAPPADLVAVLPPALETAPTPGPSGLLPPNPLQTLRDRAAEQMARLALTTPPGDNAFETLQEVLARAPNDPEATAALQRITDLYLSWADSAAQRGDRAQARTYLERALVVTPDSEAASTMLAALGEQTVPEPLADLVASASTLAAPQIRAAPAPSAAAPPAASAPIDLTTPAAPVQTASIATPSVARLSADLLTRPDELRAALRAGADPDVFLMEGKTALMIAAENGWSRTATVLLDNGASPNLPNSSGGTPLMYAAFSGDPATVMTLLRHGAAPGQRNIDGKTALMAAALNGNTDVVRMLVEAGSPLDATTVQGWTALMYAAWAGHDGVVASLLRAGANPRLRNEDGETAETIARARGHGRIASLL